MAVRRKALALYGAVTLGYLHLLVVGTTLLTASGHGFATGVLLSIIDLPLVILLSFVEGGLGAASPEVKSWLFFGVGGTVMYGLVGALIGNWLGRIVKVIKLRRGD
jgi:hypothetical protein